MYVIPGLLCFACLGLALWFIACELTGHMVTATVLKGCASLSFVLLGFWCLNRAPSEYGVLILVGLILGAVGDVFLNMRFLFTGDLSNKVFAVGIFAFLSGHFLYIAALIRQGPPIAAALIAAVVLSVVSIPQLMKHVTAPSKGLMIFGHVYLMVIIAMFSLAAVLLAAEPNALHGVFGGGALLFLISDFLMIYYSFGKKLKPLRIANLMLYYVGQLMIACTMLLA